MRGPHLTRATHIETQSVMCLDVIYYIEKVEPVAHGEPKMLRAALLLS